MPTPKKPTRLVELNQTTDNVKNWCIAITGAVATGKSTVADILRKLDFTVIDADKLARAVVEPGEKTLDDIIQAFGDSILTNDGRLDRDHLRNRIMSDKNARTKLEHIMHPAIQEKFYDVVQKNKFGHGKIFFYEASLIFELGRENLFREIWSTTCDPETQLIRLQHRSQLPTEACRQIIASQLPAAEKAARATHAIDTACPLPELAKKVEDLVKATVS